MHKILTLKSNISQKNVYQPSGMNPVNTTYKRPCRPSQIILRIGGGLANAHVLAISIHYIRSYIIDYSFFLYFIVNIETAIYVFHSGLKPKYIIHHSHWDFIVGLPDYMSFKFDFLCASCTELDFFRE